MIELVELRFVSRPQLVNFKYLDDCRIHLASWNGSPEVFVRDREKWASWNEWRGQKDEFNRTNILTLIDFIMNLTYGFSVASSG